MSIKGSWKCLELFIKEGGFGWEYIRVLDFWRGLVKGERKEI